MKSQKYAPHLNEQKYFRKRRTSDKERLHFYISIECVSLKVMLLKDLMQSKHVEHFQKQKQQLTGRQQRQMYLTHQSLCLG